MHLRRKIAGISLFFIIASALITFLLALTSDYKYNLLTLTGAEEYRESLIEDLSINDNLFLLTPKLFLNYKINKLEYVEVTKIERVLPNEVFITVKTNNPEFCDSGNLYFTESILEKSVQVERLCLDAPKILNYSSFDDFELFMKEYQALQVTFLDKVMSVETNSNYFSFIMNDGTTIDVYLSDFSKVNYYLSYQINNSYLDLRPKYS